MGLERDAFGTDDPRLETRSLPIVCQALGSPEPARETGRGSRCQVLPSSVGSPANQWGLLVVPSATTRSVRREQIGPEALHTRLANRVHEFVKQRSRVVRARGGFWVILDGEDRMLAVLQSFHGTVVEVDVRHL